MPTSTRISCTDVEALLPALADDQVRLDDAPDIYDHLAGCPACQESLALHDLCSLALAGDKVPAHSPPRIVHYHLPRGLAIAATLLIALLLGLVAWRHSGATTAEQTRLAEAQTIEILDILPPGPEQPHPLYLIRRGGANGETMLVDPSMLDQSIIDADRMLVPKQVPVMHSRH